MENHYEATTGDEDEAVQQKTCKDVDNDDDKKKDNIQDAKDATEDENEKEKDEMDIDDKVQDTNTSTEDDRNPYPPDAENDHYLR